MEPHYVLTLFSIVVVWLAIVSVVLYRIFVLFNILTKGVGHVDLRKILELVISKEKDNTTRSTILEKKIDFIQENSRSFVQKIGIVRFNPFKELGGDHSFSLAILNGEDSGVIITSLHTRDRTRVYMKDIKKGKSTFELSSEEKKALHSAHKG